MSDEVLKVGLIGCGRIAFGHAEGFKNVPGVEIRALCDRRAGKAENLKEQAKLVGASVYGDYRDMLQKEKLDIVSVLVPDNLHYPVVRDVLRHRLHVICEKPLALSGGEAVKLARTAEKAGVIHGVRMPYRFHPAYRFLRTWIEGGHLGLPFHLRARLCVERLSSPDISMEWRMRSDIGGYGALADLGSHILDLFDYLLPEWTAEIRSVTGTARIFYSHRREPKTGKPQRVTALDAATVSLSFAGGPLAVMEVSRFSPGEHFFQADGERGSLRFDGEKVEIYEKTATDHQRARSEFFPVSEQQIRQVSCPDFFIFFVDCCRKNEPFSPDFRQGARIMRRLDRIYRSLMR